MGVSNDTVAAAIDRPNATVAPGDGAACGVYSPYANLLSSQTASCFCFPGSVTLKDLRTNWKTCAQAVCFEIALKTKESISCEANCKQTDDRF